MSPSDDTRGALVIAMPLRDRTPSAPRLHARLRTQRDGAQSLHVTNDGDAEARLVVIHAYDARDGHECSWIVEVPTSRRLAPGATMELHVADGTGPRELRIELAWVDIVGREGRASVQLSRALCARERTRLGDDEQRVHRA